MKDKTLSSKNQNHNSATSQLGREIYQLFYRFYDLIEEGIKIEGGNSQIVLHRMNHLFKKNRHKSSLNRIE